VDWGKAVTARPTAPGLLGTYRTFLQAAVPSDDPGRRARRKSFRRTLRPDRLSVLLARSTLELRPPGGQWVGIFFHMCLWGLWKLAPFSAPSAPAPGPSSGAVHPSEPSSSAEGCTAARNPCRALVKLASSGEPSTPPSIDVERVTLSRGTLALSAGIDASKVKARYGRSGRARRIPATRCEATAPTPGSTHRPSCTVASGLIVR